MNHLLRTIIKRAEKQQRDDAEARGGRRDDESEHQPEQRDPDPERCRRVQDERADAFALRLGRCGVGLVGENPALRSAAIIYNAMTSSAAVMNASSTAPAGSCEVNQYASASIAR